MLSVYILESPALSKWTQSMSAVALMTNRLFVLLIRISYANISDTSYRRQEIGYLNLTSTPPFFVSCRSLHLTWLEIYHVKWFVEKDPSNIFFNYKSEINSVSFICKVKVIGYDNKLYQRL